ncbi:MAG: hypothetical protein A3F84_08895 [Candidatus Handelsmanbacteria bacterium RIFCSPLOWO2_12_FULL_64_10]|uniref:HEPN domain-containing protein n=1 Tax=Handelsmanbacteria sp. (strain RIFCSPLOWO2_12_FULL_64_10) TaxID=1817868 RepID=A0A1F6CL12_HANXR|nr:MAG: hypothetical protein A3F84_08895 [Candidatus Handelsmanbacteria bacterium RIFCSPLOWO2_12_FULL_64_10]
MRAASSLLDENFYRDSISRSYYAMFYAATAALLIIGQEASSHAALVAQFSEHLVNTGYIPKEFGRTLNRAMNIRMNADYDVSAKITKDLALKGLKDARRFVDAVRKFMQSKGVEVR